MDIAHGDGKHFDLLIIDDDIHFADNGEPSTVDGRPSIAQDIKHAIRESQLLVRIIGERNPLMRRHYHVQIEQLVEEDQRIVPGSARVTEHQTETIWVQAKTYEYKHISFYL